MKRILYYFGLIALPFIGSTIDLLRTSIKEVNSQTFELSSFMLLYDAIVAVVFVLAIYWIFSQTAIIPMTRIVALVFLIAGLYVVCITMLNGTFLTTSRLVPDFLAPFQAYRTLAGAVLVVVGMVKLLSRKRV